MIGSYYQVSEDMYRTPPAALPGWQTSQVPGWGTNPMRAGPPRVGVGQTSACQEKWGWLGGGIAAGFLLGMVATLWVASKA